MDNEKWPVISLNPEVQADYVRIRNLGTSHNLAEMSALGVSPSIKTDLAFWKGRVNENQFQDTPELGKMYCKVAESYGQSTVGKYYQSGLARFPGDPEAWVEGRGDIERVLRKRGWGAEGLVNIRAEERPPIPDIPIAQDIVDREVSEIMAKDPGWKLEDVREMVTKNLTRSTDDDDISDLTMDDFPSE